MSVARNRLANVGNKFQGKRKKVLCVCSAGLLRSPTAAWILSNEPFNFNTRAVGSVKDYALIPLDAAHVAWADEFVVMGPTHQNAVEVLMVELENNARGLDEANHSEKPIHLLIIDDDYGFRDPELIEIMTNKFKNIFKRKKNV